MKRKTFVLTLLLVFVVSISGCNLPGRAPLNATPDLVATQVATLLAAMPTANLEGTLTPAPSTPEIVIASPTPSNATTATLPSGDPRSSLDEPVYRDTLGNAGLWGLDDPYDDGHTRVEISGNQLVLTSQKAEGWLGWRTTFPKPADAYIEATFRDGECSGGDQFGLVFRLTEDSAGFFAVTCDGRFRLLHFDGSQFSSLLDWQNGSGILTGSNQVNRLGVWVKGDQVRLYANGSLLAETTDDQLASEGNIGVLIAAVKTPNFIVNVSEIAYWDIE